MTNGQPDSVLELSEAEQDAARSDEWHRLHPDCEACGETACMAGAGCDCGEAVGVSVDNDGWQFSHAGQCAYQHVVASGIRVLRTRDGVPLSEDMINERARNIAMGLTGVRLDGVRFEARRAPVAEADFAAEGRIR